MTATYDTADRVNGFICMTREQTWGWGKTPEEAIATARRAGKGRGARKGERLVVALPNGALDAHVDQMGTIRWDWAEDADKDASTTTVEAPTA